MKMMNSFVEGLRILHPKEFVEWDLYWIVYEAGGPISRTNRQVLKDMGWKLQHHTRTKKEMWIYDK